MPDLFLCSGVFEVQVLLPMCLENRTVLMCRYMLHKRDTLVSTDTYFIPVSQFLRLRSLWLAADQERLLNESPLRGHLLVLRGEHRARPQGKVFVLGFWAYFCHGHPCSPAFQFGAGFGIQLQRFLAPPEL